jgi:hypothetical protein
MLNDPAPVETDRYSRFVRNLNWLLRGGYELCTFIIVWVLADQAMVLKRTLMIRYESATTGVSTAQITDPECFVCNVGVWRGDRGDVPRGSSLPASARRLWHRGRCGGGYGIAQGTLSLDFK